MYEEVFKLHTDLANEVALKMVDLVPVAIDPICQMRVSPKTAAGSFKYKDETYYFVFPDV